MRVSPPPIEKPMDVTGFELRMPAGAHHFVIWAYGGKLQNDDAFPKGVVPSVACSGLAPDDLIPQVLIPIQTPDAAFSFPDGIALALDPREQVWLNAHMKNGTASPVKADVRFNFYRAKKGTVKHHAQGLIVGNSTAIHIPARGDQTISAGWTAPIDLTLVEIATHQHRLGMYGNIEIVAPDGKTRSMVYENHDWQHPYPKRPDPPSTSQPVRRCGSRAPGTTRTTTSSGSVRRRRTRCASSSASTIATTTRRPPSSGTAASRRGAGSSARSRPRSPTNVRAAEPRACGSARRRRRALALGLTLAVAASACGTHTVVAASPPAAGSAPAAKDRIRIMEPADVAEGTTTRMGSGEVVAIRIAEGLRLAGYHDVTILHASKEAEARKAALAVHARFLVVPTVLEWVDRAPAFAPNRVRIRVDLHDLAADDRIVATVTFAASSRRALRKPGAPRLLDDSFRRTVARLVTASGEP